MFPLCNYDSADLHPDVSVCPSGGGVGFVTWSPLHTYNSAALLFLSVLFGGGVFDTWTLSCTPDSALSTRPGGRDCFYQAQLAHPRIRRGPRSSRESQLTPQIPTRMSSVGYPDIDSRSSCHYFYFNRNTTARPIQIEEKDLSIYYFIIKWKERYLRPRVIVFSIIMPTSEGMATSSGEA